MADIYNTFNSQRKCGRHTFSMFGTKKTTFYAQQIHFLTIPDKKKIIEDLLLCLYIWLHPKIFMQTFVAVCVDDAELPYQIDKYVINRQESVACKHVHCMNVAYILLLSLPLPPLSLSLSTIQLSLFHSLSTLF